ncbi:MAG: hypothetical protein H6906_00310 [Hyphomicrobiales bacterium]|nr:hypothetical protein [Hyphomicrobiales bacterium]
MHAWKVLVLTLVVTAGLAAPAAAQPAAVTLTVRDGGGPLSGVRVSAVSAGGTLLATDVTDSAGRVDLRLPRGVRLRLRLAAPAGMAEAALVVGRDLPCAGTGPIKRCAGTVTVDGLRAMVGPVE